MWSCAWNGRSPPLPEDVLHLERVSVRYRSLRGETVIGCESVSLAVPEDRSIGLVGESGHGKSTILSVVSAVRPPDSGVAFFRGASYRIDDGPWRMEFNRNVQFVSQNPYAAFNPRLTILRQVAAPARFLRRLPKKEAISHAYEMLATVGLDRDVGGLKPAALSGGMLQRTAIARALICEPRCLVLDEPTASLSPEGTREVVSVLRALRQRRDRCSILISSHDLDVISGLCDEVHVVYRSNIVDRAPLERLREVSTNEYTRLLMTAWSSTTASNSRVRETPTMAIHRRYLDLSWGQAHVLQNLGSGPLVLCLHKVTSASSFFRALIDPLAELGYSVAALDLPGYGMSDPPLVADASLAWYGNATIEVVDALGFSSAWLLGNKTGVSVAMRAAVDRPARVDGLLLWSVPYLFPEMQAYLANEKVPVYGRGGEAILKRWQKIYQSCSPALAEIVATRELGEALLANQNHPIAHRALARDDHGAMLAAITQRTAIFANRDDSLLAETQRAAKDMPSAT
jgi:peptide/nickel transport system ATP-binding protein